MPCTTTELQHLVDSIPFWHHSIDLGQGVVSHGIKTPEYLVREVQALRIPDLTGKTVLDINTWDGFYAFEAERRGASEVTALDQYVWAMDWAANGRYHQGCKASGTSPAPYYEWSFFKLDELPGKRGFDIAHQLLGSRVKAVVGDFMRMDLATLGMFDVVFFFGTLYHMEDPLGSIRRLASVTREVALIETEAILLPGYEDRPMCEFFPADELGKDPSNWWSPNAQALMGMCKAAGFRKVDLVSGPPPTDVKNIETPVQPVRYRAMVHAWK